MMNLTNLHFIWKPHSWWSTNTNAASVWIRRNLIKHCKFKIYRDKMVHFCIYFCFIDYAKNFDCVDYNKLWKILQEMGIPDHQTCLLRTLYAGQEATGRTGHGTTDWFQTVKGARQGCILSPYLFNLYTEYIRSFLIAQLVKNLLAMWETWVQFLGWEDPLKKGMATHSSILAWRILWTV